MSLYLAQAPPRYAEAEAVLMALINDQCQTLAGSAAAINSSLDELVNIYLTQTPPKYADAEILLIPLVEELRERLGGDHVATLAGLSTLMRVYLNRSQPKYAESELSIKKGLEVARRQYGAGSRVTAYYSTQLASLYFKQGKYTAAESLLLPVVNDAILDEVVLAKRVALDEGLGLLNGIDLLAQVTARLGKSQQVRGSREQIQKCRRDRGELGGSPKSNVCRRLELDGYSGRDLFAAG